MVKYHLYSIQLKQVIDNLLAHFNVPYVIKYICECHKDGIRIYEGSLRMLWK